MNRFLILALMLLASMSATVSAADAWLWRHGQMRIMPLGDSITNAGPGWRTKLQSLLTQDGWTYRMVGGRNDPLQVEGISTYSSGFAGWTIGNLPASQNFGGGDADWAAQKPDVILFHMGTNDLQWGSLAGIDTRLSEKLDEIWTALPNVIILVAKIIPGSDAHTVNDQGVISYNSQVDAYNLLVPQVVAAKRSAGRKCGLVDQWTGFDKATMLADAVHPNQAGYQHMADVWLAAMQSLLAGNRPSTNLPPLVSARSGGATSVSVAPGQALAVQGSLLDDDGQGTVTYTWSKAYGPGAVVFGDAHALSTTATLTTPGAYALRLTASDGSSSTNDFLRVLVTGTALAGTGTAGHAISIAFNDASGLTASDSAGMVAKANWTVISQQQLNQSMPYRMTGLKDDSGASTSLVYRMAGNGTGAGTLSGAPASGDGKLMSGCYYTGANSCSHFLTGIPYAHYDLYLYFRTSDTTAINNHFVNFFSLREHDSDRWLAQLYAMNIPDFTGNWTLAPSSSWADQQAATPSGNVAVFPDLDVRDVHLATGGTFDSWAENTNNWHHTPLSGLQIIERTGGGVQTSIPPSITSTAPSVATVGQTYTYQLAASGSPAPTFSLGTAPSGMTIASNSGLITWTPTATGNVSATVSAANGVAPTASQSWVITVAAAPSTGQAPTITSTAPLSATVGESYDYMVTASGTPAPTFSLTTHPAGMVVNGNTGSISWTPAASGSASVTVSAANGVNPVASQSFTIVVADAPPADDPLLTGVPFGDANGAWNASSSTFDKVFDGDTTTFYDCASSSGGFTGIDLGAGVSGTVTSLRFWPRDGQPSRMIGGIFEAANALSGPWTTLLSVTTQPVTGEWTRQRVASVPAWRFLRYRGPDNGNCNVAEIEFHGLRQSSGQVAAPQFSPADGSFSTAQTVSISCATSGSSIHYTTDGSAPTGSSPLYVNALMVSATTTIKAFAQQSGSTDSAVSSATYIISPVVSTVSTPTFSPAGGSFSSAQSVSLGTSTAGADIHYTIDGSTPTASSPLYVGAIAVASTTTITALAHKAGMNDSAVVSATFTITPVVSAVAAPTFSPASGTYANAQLVTLSTATAGATIRYTTDGSTPTGSSSVYASAIPVSASTTITALAQKSGMTDSPVVMASYTITSATPLPTPAAPDGSSHHCGTGSGLVVFALLSLVLVRGLGFLRIRARR